MKIGIVGPGIMPIPPVGWGACEILIWDYAKTLELLGHECIIYNTQDMNHVISLIKNDNLDIVHIQYDNYAHIADKISSFVKLVLITSHFGYIEQLNKWGGYIQVFNQIKSQTQENVYHAVLSQGIKEVYLKHGIPENRIFVTPNGANASLFKYIEAPQELQKSIYLAKIDNRKRQYLFQEISSLHFAGNVADKRFNTKSLRYLGEWSKDTLYSNLSHYGNLVLLSDGEADPLVVKEALVCGLGLVISEYSTAGLDLTKPYITVIPENKISDVRFVESELIRNKNISAKMRSEIREYGLTFDWEILVKMYEKKITSITNEISSSDTTRTD